MSDMPNMFERPITELYPPTHFVDEYIHSNRTADLVRSVVLVDVLSEGNPLAEQWLSDIANLGISAVLEEESPHVQKAVENIDAAFEVGLATLMANTAHQTMAEYPYRPGITPERTADTYLRLWEMIKVGDPGLQELERRTKDKGPAIHGEATQALYLETIRNIGHALLWSDARRLDPAHDQRSQGVEPPSSRFRDVILDGTTKTGIIIFDESFGLLRKGTLGGFQPEGVAIVAGMWRYWHPKQQGESFLPEDYLADMAERKDSSVVSRKSNKAAWLALWIDKLQQLEIAQMQADHREL